MVFKDAGKTTHLLQANFNYNQKGMETLIFTPKIDNRVLEEIETGLTPSGALYPRDSHRVSSRIGIFSPAVGFGKEFDFFEYVHSYPKNLQAIFVDEAQFLESNQVRDLGRICDSLNIPVLCYGLRNSFLGQAFPGSAFLFATCDKLSEIKSVCFCGKKATHNARMDGLGNILRQGPEVVIGGNELYSSLCR